MERGVKIFPWAVTEGWSGAFWANAANPARKMNSFNITASSNIGQVTITIVSAASAANATQKRSDQ
jgi:hypothetical protein